MKEDGEMMELLHFQLHHLSQFLYNRHSLNR